MSFLRDFYDRITMIYPPVEQIIQTFIIETQQEFNNLLQMLEYNLQNNIDAAVLDLQGQLDQEILDRIDGDQSVLDIVNSLNLALAQLIEDFNNHDHPDKYKTFLGPTDSNGEFSITYLEEITPAPVVVPAIMGDNSGRYIYVVSATTIGFTVKVQHRESISILTINVPVTLTNSNAIPVGVLIIRQN
jgi:hypothetical protein